MSDITEPAYKDFIARCSEEHTMRSAQTALFLSLTLSFLLPFLPGSILYQNLSPPTWFFMSKTTSLGHIFLPLNHCCLF